MSKSQHNFAHMKDVSFETRLVESVERGIADIDSGRYVTSPEEALNRARALREERLFTRISSQADSSTGQTR